MLSTQVILGLFLLAVNLASCVPVNNSENPSSVTVVKEPSSLLDSESLSPLENAQDTSQLVEVREEDIPDGSWVYVLEEPEQGIVEGEGMNTADNIAFRPLFHYRAKQEKLQRRRISNRARRRYFVSRRPNRNAYYYPRYRYRY